VENTKNTKNTENAPSTQTEYGVRAALSGFPVREPIVNSEALAEAIRVQARTWVVSQWGVSVPVDPAALGGVDGAAAMLARVVRSAEYVEEGNEDRTAWGMAHMIHADADGIRAANGHGDGYLLGALYSLIVASAYLWGGYDGDSVAFSPYPNDRPAVDESALIETARTLVQVYAPDDSRMIGVGEFGVYIPPRGSWLDGPRFSDLIAQVADSFERRYGDHDGEDEIRAMAHLVNAREHALKAGHSHGAPYVFAALSSLVLAVASMGHL